MVFSKIIVALLLGSLQDINLNPPTGVFLNSPADILIRSCIRLVEFSNSKRGCNLNSPMGVLGVESVSPVPAAPCSEVVYG